MLMPRWTRACISIFTKPPSSKKMKSILKLAAFALATSLTACGNNNSTTSTTGTDSNAETHAMMSASPTGIDSGTSMSVNARMSDQDFVTKASSANAAEIEMHKAAKTHAQSADVKMHAQHMLTDHQKLADEMKSLASQKGLTVSTDLPADKKQIVDDMNTKKGKDWDMAYLDQQVKDHQEPYRSLKMAQQV